jgi:DNA-binding NarL/FixJ family response regulator
MPGTKGAWQTEPHRSMHVAVEKGVPQFLVVEDDPLVADGVRLVLERHGSVRVAGSLAAARKMLDASAPGRCLIVDVGLPDGSGLDLLDEYKDLLEKLDVLVLTGMFERDLINRAVTLGARYAVKPISTTDLDEFVRSLAPRTLPNQNRNAIVDRESARFGLTTRETELVRLHVDGKPRNRIIKELNISPKTYANHVTSILTKTELPNMAALTIRLLLEAHRVGAKKPE